MSFNDTRRGARGGNFSGRGRGRGNRGGGGWRGQGNWAQRGGRSAQDNRNGYQQHHHHSSGPVGGGARDPQNLRQFLASLRQLQPSKLPKAVEAAQSLWKDCWESQSLSFSSLDILLTTVARFPFSGDTDAPPLHECCASIQTYLRQAPHAVNGDSSVVANVDVVINAVQRLLKFTWNNEADEVRDALVSVLETSMSYVTGADQESRRARKEIDNLFEELEKDWTIMVKPSSSQAASVVGPEPTDPHLDWRNATVAWLTNLDYFQPNKLPVMKTPDTNYKGVYDSAEEYFDTVIKLFIGMTFSDGNNALNAQCRYRKDNKECGHVLWPVRGGHAGSGLTCRIQNCGREAVFVCPNRFHSQGLCSGCAKKAQAALRAACTHVYDGRVTRVSYDASVFMDDVVSRRPPQANIHWRTSRRLQCPNLVGIVKLGSKGSALRPTDAIIWAQICPHGFDRNSREEHFREQGKLAVSLLNVEDGLVEEVDAGLHKGDRVAIIDCQTFCPEYIPVLKALEAQKRSVLPFDGGSLLNLCRRSSDRPSLASATGPTLTELLEDEDDDTSSSSTATVSTVPSVAGETREKVRDMVMQSHLDPIIQIRRDSTATSQLIDQLTTLVKTATLDEGQFNSFVGALKHPVHCTQGPPGTGKSYLGVVIVRALMKVRAIWLRTTKSAGEPPILILSYKNHAIDEFLCDLVRTESTIGRFGGTSLIRLGSGCNDPRLAAFSESTATRSAPEVKEKRRELEELHKLHDQLAGKADLFSDLSFAKADLLQQDLDDEHRKKWRALANNTATTLSNAIKWIQEEEDRLDATDGDDDGDLSVHAKHNMLFEDVERLLTTRGVPEYRSIDNLYQGIKHYDANLHVQEILLRWLVGWVPLPQCAYGDMEAEGRCVEVALEQSQYCSSHQCAYTYSDEVDGSVNGCPKATAPGKVFCVTHACDVVDCQEMRVRGRGQLYCRYDACLVCLANGDGPAALQDNARQTCAQHILCSANVAGALCGELALDNSQHCEMHQVQVCKGTTQKGGACKARAISRDLPYCSAHKSQSRSTERLPEKRNPGRYAMLDEEDEEVNVVQCQALTKKGKACKGKPLPGKRFCVDHNQAQTPTQNDMWVALEAVAAPSLQSTNQEIIDPTSLEVGMATHSDVIVSSEVTADSSSRLEDDDTVIVELDDVFEDDDDSGHDPAPEVDRIGHDNIDEIAESDHLQHLRDVFAVQDDDDDELAAARVDDADDESQSVASGAEISDMDTSRESPTKWTWDMSIDQRWEAIDKVVARANAICSQAAKVLTAEINNCRKAYYFAKVRANARVYEGKSIIGGTIVGCVSRLQALRNIKPFAILVEEASEVLEPLLFACIGSTTVKLEMIGDHLQLQPSVMSKFDFEKFNKINVSMFERLIRAPPEASVPHNVLSIQRRMRKNICDLTRDFYRDITPIYDHAKCETKVIDENMPRSATLRLCEGKGREVPGVQPHLFFWTHSGREERASVGLSKVNPTEAKMVCHLADYLVHCGVPPASIAILTPYKGQLMLLRQLLRRKSLIIDRQSDKSCVLSTVDRFQGDEADIVIASLVIDSRSRTPFVKLVNRMIVLLSRARLGLYIIGNDAYFSSNPLPHWTKTLEALSRPAQLDSTINVHIYEGGRVGEALPLCCPQHRSSSKLVVAPADLKLGFCEELCKEGLLCSHPCNLPCHWPHMTHNSSCNQLVTSPCARHSADLTCGHIRAHVKPIARAAGAIDKFLPFYRCPEKVQAMLPCTHRQVFACADEEEFSSGAKPWPKCAQPSSQPYVYPDCKHQLHGECAQIAGYWRDPTTAPRCVQKVEYTPSCGHEIEVDCCRRNGYESGTPYLCLKGVESVLPRCGHTTKMPCPAAAELQSWTGQACAVKGVVMEGVAYGKVDYKCSERVEFVASCGHRSSLPCGTAFEHAANGIQCNVQEVIANPSCGHPLRVKCCQKHRLPQDSRLCAASPITVVDEGQVDKVFQPSVFPENCTHAVTLRRKCGHEEQVPCYVAKGSATSCKVQVEILSPLCGHKATVICGSRKSASPWPIEFIGSTQWHHLADEGILEDTVPAANLEATRWLSKCEQLIQLQRVSTCGHFIRMKCGDAFKHLPWVTHEKKDVLPPCKEEVSGVLECGHERQTHCSKYQEYLHGTNKIACDTMTTAPCWNHPVCAQYVQWKCGSRGAPSCNVETQWSCSEGHQYNLKFCQDGLPSACPACSMKALEEDITITEDCCEDPVVPDLSFRTDGNEDWADTLLEVDEDVLIDFYANKLSLLHRYHMWLMNIEAVWDRPLFAPNYVPGFILCKKNLARKGFMVEEYVSPSSLNGVLVRQWHAENFKNLARTLKNCQTVEMMAVHGFSCRALVDPPQIPDAPRRNRKANAQLTKWVDQQMKLGYDAVQYKKAGYDNIVFWDPYCLYASRQMTLTRSQLEELAQRLEESKPERQICDVEHIQFKRPSHEPLESPINEISDHSNALSGTLADGIRIGVPHEEGALSLTSELRSSVQTELRNKLHIFKKATGKSSLSPYAGIKLIQNIQASGGKTAIELFLLLTLEYALLGHDAESKQALMDYLQLVRELHNRAHPLVLLAIARSEPDDPHQRHRLLSAFTAACPMIASEILTTDEAQLAQNVTSSSTTSSKTPQARTVEQLWENVKIRDGVQSAAMDKLLQLTGLNKVKRAAIQLFESAAAFMKMSLKDRKANTLTLNYCFLGNPGTGKTTVARLFAEILHDSQLREKNTFIETTAQKLKDEGTDKFRQLVKDAEHGVLFIDEAHDIDPMGDFKGKPIVAELLTIAENERDKLSIILAGYEDDMNKKLYAFNDGLKSRFEEILFEDFDEYDLSTVWCGMLADRGWVADKQVGNLVVKRLVKQANRKGFGNARSVRKCLEAATKKAMSRDDFEGRLELQVIDVAGEDPMNNAKLKLLLDELNEKTGWGTIKHSVNELLSVCQKNYERELQGIEPLAIFVNRLCLGSPGTGKTTFATLYSKILKQLNILSVGEVVMKTASDFVGQHVGESQTKTGAILEAAKGKVLVIDEAYNLDDNMYGKQVLDVFVEKVQGPQDDMAVLMLGYEEPMLAMLRNQNAGLARRFPPEYAFRFEDYTDMELREIFLASARKANVAPPSLGVMEQVLHVLTKQRSMPNFGNAGTVNTLLANAISKAVLRQNVSDKIVLEPADFETGARRMNDPFAPLNDLYRVDNIRRELTKLRDTFLVAQDEGKTPDVGHFVFRGSPGTGKTTVARVMGSILFSLGLLPVERVVDTTGLELTGEYVGHTKKRVEEKLGEARGGILFIDEAYTLGQGAFGSEALTALVAAMTNPKYKGTVIVIAGYPTDIDMMLAQNAGLKSRFNRYIDFEDWSASDAVNLFSDRAKTDNYRLDEEVTRVLQDGLSQLRQLPGWGNGRDVNQLWEQTLSTRASRVVSQRELEKSIIVDDVNGALAHMIQQRVPPSGPLLNVHPGDSKESFAFENKPEFFHKVVHHTQQHCDVDEASASDETQEEDHSPRDQGVGDAEWAELEHAKELYRRERQQYEDAYNEAARKAELEAMELRRLQQELELATRQMALQRQRELEETIRKEKAKEAEALRRKKAMEEELRKKTAIQQALRRLSSCPQGYAWLQVGGGWRCRGGSHFVTDAELNRQFSS
ncbi:P-loop containing nucleoside triphosphate hydrolase protein [Gaertneriomyces semiglobifer]|nr:P-loop containing nucleoside triphosphate hydrolase protein [Gaertneriomyces semiglobifer]